jgi:ABC-2 type transport system permease protein
MMSVLARGTHADFGLILSNLLGVWLLASCYASLGLYFSSLTRQPVVAAFAALAISFGLWMLEMSSGFLHALSPNAHFQNLDVGLISSVDVCYFILFIVAFLLLSIRRIRHERGGK